MPEVERVESNAEPGGAAKEINRDDGRDSNQNKGYRFRSRGTLRLPETYHDFVDNLFLAENHEPSSYHEATESKEATLWKKAMDKGFESLTRNNVWELVEAFNNPKTIDCKWTFTLKRDVDGNIQRYKMRLDACGFRQREGIDYQETYSSVVRFDSIRTILATAASDHMRIKQFHVKMAFLSKKQSTCSNRRNTMMTSQINNEKLILTIYIDDGLVVLHNKTLSAYCEAVRILMYFLVTRRPDISFSVHQASRYLENSATMHWKAVKQVTRYLKATIRYGLHFECSKKKELLAYSDAGYAGELETRRSTTGFILKIASVRSRGIHRDNNPLLCQRRIPSI